MSKASVTRILEVLDEKPDIVNHADGDIPVENGSIVFENVSFKYTKGADKNVLENINLDIKSGQTIGII